jgi:hypothetical protein
VGVTSPGEQLGDTLRSWSRLYSMDAVHVRKFAVGHNLYVALLKAICEGKGLWRVVCVDSEEGIEGVGETLDLFDS